MKLHRISFYDNFTCATDQCPDTCCAGWNIPVDRETIQKWQTYPLSLRLWLFPHLCKKEDIPCIRMTHTHCPFQDHDMLCSLERHHGENAMPHICRIYPRKRRNYGFCAEETLELSCPKAAELFLGHLHDFHYVDMDSEISYPVSGTNQDAAFFEDLLFCREELISFLQTAAMDFPAICAVLIRYAKKQQEFWIAHGFSFSDGIQPNSLYTSEDFPHPAPADQTDAFLISGDILSRMISEGLYHKKLRTTSPFLYELCHLYFDEFSGSKKTPDARQHLMFLHNDLQDVLPDVEDLLRSYYIYYLDSCFLDIFETYSFLKTIASGIIHVSLIWLFFSLYHQKYHTLTSAEQARIIAAYEKRARHNDVVLNAMYEALTPLFTNMQ